MALITCDVNVNQLSQYMNSLIQVVNQHAKLLDTISNELNQKVKKNDIGDMFDVLSRTFPFEKILEKQGLDPNTPLPRSPFIAEQLLRRQVNANAVFSEQIKSPVEDMWEGFDRYLKT